MKFIVAPKDKAAQVRQTARALAERATTLGADDPIAHEVLRKLAKLRAAAGLPLKSLALSRGLRVAQEADGKFAIHVDESAAGQADTPNYAIRLLLGMSASNQRQPEDAGSKSPLMFRQSYRPALDAWLATNPGGVKLFIDRYGLRP